MASKAKTDTKSAGAREEDAEDGVRWRLMIHCDDLRREELKGKEDQMDGWPGSFLRLREVPRGHRAAEIKAKEAKMCRR